MTREQKAKLLLIITAGFTLMPVVTLVELPVRMSYFWQLFKAHTPLYCAVAIVLAATFGGIGYVVGKSSVSKIQTAEKHEP